MSELDIDPREGFPGVTDNEYDLSDDEIHYPDGLDPLPLAHQRCTDCGKITPTEYLREGRCKDCHVASVMKRILADPRCLLCYGRGESAHYLAYGSGWELHMDKCPACNGRGMKL